MERDQLCEQLMIDALLARERRHRRVREAWLECGHGRISVRRAHQPCGSVSKMPMSASSFSMKACRSLLAVGNGGRVGPTRRPMSTMPPLSDDGYWSLNRCQSRVILYCSSRARAHSPLMHESNSSAHRFGQIEPAAE